MAVVEEKSRGLKFAERQLLRHGWEHGKGLGRAENGIAEAIKVKVKSDKGGVGHKEGEQFTFQWWDHVFNKASSSLQVESDHNGTHLKKTVEEDEEDGMISNKRPRKAALAKAKLYGCFVKSATLLSGQEQPEPRSSSSDDSSSSEEEDDQKLDLSSTTNLSDAELMRVCGGRTAHKGARHGLTMSAKLARLEQQEAEFMAKYGKKNDVKASPKTPPAPQTAEHQQEEKEEKEEKPREKKKKKKRCSGNELNGGDASERTETDVKAEKKAEEDSIVEISDDSVICVGNTEADLSSKTKKKRKKKKKNREEQDEAASAAAESPEETAQVVSVTEVETKKKKKKKKKSSKHLSEPAEEEEESNDTESSQSEPRIQSGVRSEEAEVPDGETVQLQIKKSKKAKRVIDDNADKETLPPKKKKKKKSKN